MHMHVLSAIARRKIKQTTIVMWCLYVRMRARASTAFMCDMTKKKKKREQITLKLIHDFYTKDCLN